jgi:Tol biopolymer transport system component
MIKSIFKFLFLFCSVYTAMAQQNLTIDNLWQLGRVADAQVSNDGKTVIFGVRNYSIKTNKSTNIIYSITINGENKTALTDGDLNAFGARFTPNGNKISFLSAKSGDEFRRK